MENLNDLRSLTRDAARYRILKEIIDNGGLKVEEISSSSDVDAFVDREIDKIYG